MTERAITRAMNIALRTRPMTREEFFPWAQAQDIRYEFDGTQPVAMTGGTMGHSQIMLNIQAALRSRLKGGPCRPLGPDAGIATVGSAVRYPDALITCSKFGPDDLLAPNAVVVFEVLSKTSGPTDRIAKVREYQAVASILRYIVVERASIGMTVFERAQGTDPWTASTLSIGDVLRVPEVAIDIPVGEFYEGTNLDDNGSPDSDPGDEANISPDA